jgi:hypothetical protein
MGRRHRFCYSSFEARRRRLAPQDDGFVYVISVQ